MTTSNRITTSGTLVLGFSLAFAALAAPPKPKSLAKPGMSMAAMAAHGKTLAVAKKCNTCHGANFGGVAKFAPSLRADGKVLHEYNATTWARVMNTGVTEDGGKVKAPMPVYHLKAKDSAALWGYFKTLK